MLDRSVVVCHILSRTSEFGTNSVVLYLPVVGSSRAQLYSREAAVAYEGVIELFSHRDDRASRIVSAFVIGDSDDKAKAQRKKHLRPCVDAASGECSPEAAVLH